jgi:hypothetical protein
MVDNTQNKAKPAVTQKTGQPIKGVKAGQSVSATKLNSIINTVNKLSGTSAVSMQNNRRKIVASEENLYECTNFADKATTDVTVEMVEDKNGTLDGISETFEKLDKDIITVGDTVIKKTLADGSEIYVKINDSVYIVDTSVAKSATQVDVYKYTDTGEVFTVTKNTSEHMYKGDKVLLLKDNSNNEIAWRVMDYGKGSDILTTKVLLGSGNTADTNDWEREPVGGALSEPMSFRTYRIAYNSATGQLLQFYRTVEVDVNGLIKKVSEETSQVITTAVDCP